MAQAKLKVVLLRATPDPDELVALGARLCYAQADIDALKEKVESADQRAFVERVMQRGHLSVTVHVRGRGREPRPACPADAPSHRVVLGAEPALCFHGEGL